MYNVELRLVDKDFQDIAIIDTFISLSWTDKYNEYGEFEIVLPLTQENVELYKKDYYVWKNDTEHLMIIETIEIDESNNDSNAKFKISGKSLESILNRRIIWSKKEFAKSSKLQDDIKTLLNDAIISPTNTNRKISNFIFEASEDTNITELTHEGEYEGDNLYDVIKDICGDKHLGFKITLNSSNQFVFKLYFGDDRSTEQTSNSPIIFSDEYDNLFNSEYIESTADYKNTCLYKGENASGIAGDDITGLDRREMYESNSNSSSSSSDVLKQRATEKLERYAITSAVDGDIEVNNDVQMFTYREDYFVGDWITFRNRWGKESKARITEMLLSGDTSGITLSPTFTTKKEEEDEDAENKEEEDNESDSSSSSSSTTTDSDDD